MKNFRIIFFLLILASPAVFSQNYNDILRLAEPGLGANARSLGMGNAYNSLSDDASASFFNPAGLGLLKRLEFSGGIDYFSYNNNTSFLNTQTDYSNSQTQLNRVSFAFPFPTMRGSLVFGISYNRSKGLVSALKFDAFNPGNTSRIQDMLEYSDIPYQIYLADENYVTNINGRLNQSGNNLASGSIGNWTFSGAIEATRNFFIGANLNIITGSYNSSSDYYEDDERGIYQNIQADPSDPGTTGFQTFNLNNIIDWDISGWDAKVGFIYQLEKFARFGATIQFPKSYTVKEKWDQSAYAQFTGFKETYAYNDEVEYDITTPYNFTGGFALNYAGLIFSAEATMIDYTQSEFDASTDIYDKSIISDINLELKELLRTVINYNIGLEYTIPNIGLRLRGGFLTQPSAFKDDPSEFDRKYLTGGIGYLADETIGIDLGYAYGWWNTFGDNYGQGESRTNQEININNFVFTFTYRF